MLLEYGYEPARNLLRHYMKLFLDHHILCQIRDWVSVEVDMLRTQSVAVGDVEDILQQLDKQKVSTLNYISKKIQGYCGSWPSWQLSAPSCFVYTIS